MANTIDTTDTIDDRIIQMRLDGRSVRSITDTLKVPAARVRATVSAWAAASLPADRLESLALQLGRIERLLADFTPLARSGNMKALTACVKLLNQQALLLGLYQPTQSIVQLEPTPHRETSTDKIERALNALLEDQKRESAH
jgi:hypothetical protein